MHQTALSVDVTDLLPADVAAGQRLAIAAWVFAPEATEPHVGRPVVTALLNGGTYDKRYFHFEVPGRTGYSAAQSLCDRGHVVILLDHLGVGESSRSRNQMLVTRQVGAAANHAALEEIYRRLRAGTLDPAIAAMPDFLKAGGGHSMGGMVAITQQAEHRTYDRLLVLGYTAVGVHLSIGGKLVAADRGPLDTGKPDYTWADRSMLREGFHWEDVPDDVVAVDDALQVEVPYMLSAQSLATGIVTQDAARIDVPVYICLGERDVSPDPYAEPSYYRGTRDVILHILPRSGHCQSFASTRHEMYERIDGWLRSIA